MWKTEDAAAKVAGLHFLVACGFTSYHIIFSTVSSQRLRVTARFSKPYNIEQYTRRQRSNNQSSGSTQQAGSKNFLLALTTWEARPYRKRYGSWVLECCRRKLSQCIALLSTTATVLFCDTSRRGKPPGLLTRCSVMFIVIFAKNRS